LSQTPVKVTRIITWLPVGGIERRLVSIFPKLRDRGFDMNLILIREMGPLAQELIDQDFSVKLVPLKSRLDPFGILRLGKEFKATKPDILHCHMYRSSVPGTIAGHYSKVPTIFSQVHNVDTWESKRQLAMDQFLSKWRTGTIAVSRAVQQDVVKNLQIPKNKVPVIYNGCDTDKFKPDDELRKATREKLGISESQPVVLAPARIHPNKYPLMVADAFYEVVKDLSNQVEKPVLLFAGSGPLEDALRGWIEKEQAGEHIKMLGKRDDMVELYNASDLMVLSSSKEGFSNAVVEALSCGKPVIAANVGGNPEVIEKPEHGWIHDSGDSGKLKEQLIEALSDVERLKNCSEECREQGLRFNLDAMVDATEALYRKAYEENHS